MHVLVGSGLSDCEKNASTNHEWTPNPETDSRTTNGHKWTRRFRRSCSSGSTGHLILRAVLLCLSPTRTDFRDLKLRRIPLQHRQPTARVFSRGGFGCIDLIGRIGPMRLIGPMRTRGNALRVKLRRARRRLNTGEPLQLLKR